VTSTPLMLRILRRMATTPDHKPSIAPVVGPDDPRRFTDSGIEIKHAYDESDVRPGLEERLGEPGEYPYTRGIHPDMYRGRKWTMRQYAGYATAAETNQRFRYLIEHGSTGLSMAFDLPTQLGRDSDDRSAWARSAAPAWPSTRSTTCGACSTRSRSPTSPRR
jgi:methylmalonyl-CoA mutase, N-terminal domain